MSAHASIAALISVLIIGVVGSVKAAALIVENPPEDAAVPLTVKVFIEKATGEVKFAGPLSRIARQPIDIWTEHLVEAKLRRRFGREVSRFASGKCWLKQVVMVSGKHIPGFGIGLSPFKQNPALDYAGFCSSGVDEEEGNASAIGNQGIIGHVVKIDVAENDFWWMGSKVLQTCNELMLLGKVGIPAGEKHLLVRNLSSGFGVPTGFFQPIYLAEGNNNLNRANKRQNPSETHKGFGVVGNSFIGRFGRFYIVGLAWGVLIGGVCIWLGSRDWER